MATAVKNPPVNAGDLRDAGSISGSRRSPGEGNGNPLQLILPGKFHGQRSLVGYSSGGRKELDRTEQHSIKSKMRFLNSRCLWIPGCTLGTFHP